MRLVCPNCDAEYEVDDTLIPPEGRDVQCSNCTTTWFQASPEADSIDVPPAEPIDVTPVEPETEAAAEDLEDDPDLAVIATAAAAAEGLLSRKPAVDKAALDIIHEEVERETSARKAELGSIETQPDLGLDDAESIRVN